jgi:NAD(P)-dependent dehydrogenase (short-subunit alcohol dehydrogenase family)
VILTITGTPARMAFPNVGGNAPAFAAVVALTRTLSAELAPQGVRVVCLMPNAMPETGTATGLTPAEYQVRHEGTTHLRRLTTLAELANVAVFVASDQASAMTGTVVNLSGGTIVE